MFLADGRKLVTFDGWLPVPMPEAEASSDWSASVEPVREPPLEMTVSVDIGRGRWPMPAGCWRPSASSSLVITLTMLRTVDSSNCDHGLVGARMRRKNSECHFWRSCIKSAAASASTRNTSQSSRRSVARRRPFEPASPSPPLSPSLSLLLLFRDPSSAAISPTATHSQLDSSFWRKETLCWLKATLTCGTGVVSSAGLAGDETSLTVLRR